MEKPLPNMAVAEIAAHCKALSSLVPLHIIRNPTEYDRAVTALNGLLDAGAANEDHPLADLVHTLGLLIGDYDDEHFAPELGRR